MSTKFAVVFASLFISLAIIDAAPAALESDALAQNGPHVIPPIVVGSPPEKLNVSPQPRKVLRRRKAPLEKSDKIAASNNVQTMQQRDSGKSADYYYYYYYY
uniref:Uncharacterized protein n=1 Tax=Panagrolaimus sp. ES5 TaxID=591445 RepID=A0AC34F7I5_9BILA